jgi:hypothetical protein
MLPLLNKVLNDGCLTIQDRVQKAIAQGRSAPQIVHVAKRSARLFWMNYLLTWGLVSGFVYGANQLTRRGIQKAARQVQPEPATITTKSTASTLLPLPTYSSPIMLRPYFPSQPIGMALPATATQLAINNMPLTPLLLPPVNYLHIATNAFSIAPAQSFSGGFPQGMV